MYLVFILAILLSPSIAQSQKGDTVIHIVFQKTNVHYFAIDPLQNLYTISTTGLVTKYNAVGKELFTYNNTTLGELVSIDATDPFNLLLFYPEQQTLVLLDRTLSTRSTLDLRNSAIGQASAVALSHDNNIWAYDDFESQVVKIDANGKILLQSDNLRLTENIATEAKHIFRWKDKILVNFPQKGIAVFDLTAQLEDWWPIFGLLDGQTLPQGFAYRIASGHFIYLARPDTNQQFTQTRFENCSMARFQFTLEYLLDKEGVLTVFDLVR